MDKALDFASISFGFLLAVLALLLQSTGPGMQRITTGGKFPELIKYNKKVVIASALLALFALLYLSFNMHDISACALKDCASIKKYVDAFSLSLLVYQVSELFLFLGLFYEIIKQTD